jgi:AraC-like DNA-binding protein
VFGFRSDKHPQILTTDFLLLGNPGQSYEVSHEHAGGDCCLVFQFDEAILAEVAAEHRRARQHSRRYFARSVLPPLPRVTALRHVLEQRLSLGGPTLELEELAIANAAYAMSTAAEGAARPSRAPEVSPRTRDSVYRTLDWLERSTADDVHLADVARVAELSPYHFLRVFKHEIGVTPYRYLVRARIRRAVNLLITTRQSVTTIAYDVGFGDLSNFVNTFRREVGSSPTQFRRTAQRGLGSGFQVRPASLRR